MSKIHKIIKDASTDKKYILSYAIIHIFVPPYRLSCSLKNERSILTSCSISMLVVMDYIEHFFGYKLREYIFEDTDKLIGYIKARKNGIYLFGITPNEHFEGHTVMVVRSSQHFRVYQSYINHYSLEEYIRSSSILGYQQGIEFIETVVRCFHYKNNFHKLFKKITNIDLKVSKIGNTTMNIGIME